MRTIILLFIISFLTNPNPNDKKIQVIERTEAILVNKGYVVLSSDSVFEFNNKKYLIKAREFFNENKEISHAVIWSEMGYEDWPKENMLKTKHFLDDYGFSRSIEASFVDNKHIKINSTIGLIKGIDKRRRIIYYSLRSDKNVHSIIYLHRLIYKKSKVGNVTKVH
jgi:hypothetical protein